MDSNIKLYPEKFCRTCLCESLSMRSLSAKIEGENRTILEMLEFVVNINVLLENQLPTQVCSECESILHKADAFKRRCLESEMILTQQTEIVIQGQDIDEFSRTSDIKNENTVKIENTKQKEASKTFTDLTKSSNSALNKIFDSLSSKQEKLEIFSDVTISKHKNNSKKDIKSIIPEGVSVKVVKVETINKFKQDDIPFDFDDPLYETLPVDYKKEQSKETKGFTCSCGTFCEGKDEYRLHLLTTNCSGFKPKKKVKQEKKINKEPMKITKVVCSVCKQAFKSERACKIHKNKHTRTDIHTRDKRFSCDFCTKCFPTEASLTTHKESHKLQKKHVCEVCEKAFYMLSTLNDHMRVHTGEKPFLCNVCGKSFSLNKGLANHVRRHQGLKPFKCEVCDKRFVTKGELNVHAQSHSGARPFVCEDCGTGLATARSLVKHRRTHTGEKPYACDLCPMRLTTSGTLKNHRRTHTGEKPFQCSYCDKAFGQRQALISHIRSHTDDSS